VPPRRPPKPPGAAQDPFTGWLIAIRDAATAPVVSDGPVAAMHSPTANTVDVAADVWANVVLAVVVTVSSTVVMLLPPAPR
jgi:hypothetical protein